MLEDRGFELQLERAERARNGAEVRAGVGAVAVAAMALATTTSKTS